MVYLDLSDVDHSTRVDSAEVKRGVFRFTTEVKGLSSTR
jgi:hypothetical protein